MNDSQLDARLRAAFPAAAVPASLEGKIDSALISDRRRGRIVRPVRLAMTAVVCVTLMAIVGPPVYAQAMINRIAEAQDHVKSFRMTRTFIDAQGNRIPVGETFYDAGRWRTRTEEGEVLCRDGYLYIYDPIVEAYVVSPQQKGPYPHGGRIRLSDFLGTANPLSLDRRLTLEDVIWRGRKVRQVTVEERKTGQRYQIVVEPETDLAMELRAETWDRDRWRLWSIQEFDYQAVVSPESLELPKGKPVITQEERSRRVVRAMPSGELAVLPIREGRLVVRAMDVAPDGTIFVAYQSGDRVPGVWRGYAFDLRDDLGTEYARQEIFGMRDAFARLTKDGKLELEVFVPLKPLDPKRPRSLRLVARRFKNHGLARLSRSGVSEQTGRVTWSWQPNGENDALTLPKETVMVRKRVAAPTCESAPTYAKLLAPTCFRDPTTIDIFFAGIRAQRYGELERWADATRWYEEMLRRMRDWKDPGHGPYTDFDVLKKLEQIRTRTWRP